MRSLLLALGSPERRYATVLVAGTNGKGSTAALLAAMLTAAGYRTGLYTSPHLESPCERIRIDGRSIAEPRLEARLRELLRADGGAELPTYFEAFTAAALLEFAREEVRVAVVEVGMGGRLDATNLCDPVLSIVTAIDFDHREFLGDTLPAIAREKAGIFRPRRPALALAHDSEAASALAEEAARRGALWFDARLLLPQLELSADGSRVRFSTSQHRYDLPLPLAGRHQAENLLLATEAAERLAGLGFPRLDADSIGRGVAACEWPGRCERVKLAGGRTALLDAAHNPSGAGVLARELPRLPAPRALVFGALADKEIGGMLPPLAAVVDRLFLTQPRSSRAATPSALAALVAPREAQLYEEPERALDAALASDCATVVVCGSIFLVGELRAALRRRFGLPRPPR